AGLHPSRAAVCGLFDGRTWHRDCPGRLQLLQPLLVFTTTILLMTIEATTNKRMSAVIRSARKTSVIGCFHDQLAPPFHMDRYREFLCPSLLFDQHHPQNSHRA